MRGEKKRVAIFGVIVFLALFIWSIGIANAQKIEHLKDSIELRYTKPTLTLEKLTKIQESESNHNQPLINQLIAWEQVDEVQIKNEELNKSIGATMLYVFGDIKELIGKNQIAGDFPYQGDEEGALITSKVAYDLWGNLDVINKTFDYNGNSYKVRGIIEDNEPAILRQLSEDVAEEVQMSGLRVKFIETENIPGELRSFLLRYELEDAIVMNLSLMSILWNQIIYMPIWILGIWGIIKLLRVFNKTYRYWVAAIILMVIISVIDWVILRFMAIPLNIPSYLLPNQWSDFEFWSTLWNDLKSNYIEIESLPKYLPDIWRGATIKCVISFWLISSGITIWGLRKITIRDSSELFWKTLIAIVSSFIAIMVGYALGMTAIMPQAFWTALPIFMVIYYISDRWIKMLES
ncbi:hypothetical protein CS063_14360 [Sporanaerobium hydrogeniformans]|uniref:Uncharacterized protein n=1 Tax=Sporanaerobium hydrogeniformans TaxID=3072179 RepID=A0AC61DAU3_9FIRM|nr:ABC transporter permease [Sporanaerobium hydrogeniformans]PHV69677.1 hypothetical protein CS063_14360 [Sporanaerobium hydrogeniformans]